MHRYLNLCFNLDMRQDNENKYDGLKYRIDQLNSSIHNDDGKQ